MELLNSKYQEPMVDSYEFGKIVIDGKTYQHDLIILPDRIIDNWWRKNGHQLVIEDIGAIIDAAPTKLIIGTGASGVMKVSGEVVKTLASKGIQVFVLETEDACKAYNKSYKTIKTAAALHLTC